ncbi:hypothetical protein AMTRI_Chr01g126810 [Amborella trichopoda]
MPKLSHLSKLRKFKVIYCLQLVAIPELPNSLKQNLNVSYCELLAATLELPSKSKDLHAFACNSLRMMPRLSHLSKLQTLDVSCCE